MNKVTIAAAGILAILAACSAPLQEAPRKAFRAVNAPIYSAAAFQPARAAGQWRQAATYAFGAQSCPAGGLELRQSGAGLIAKGQLCLDGRQVAVNGPLTPKGHGRFGFAGMSDWWVIWVDFDYRTMAIGTPDGSFGFILDRGALPRDRLVAAAEIFDFNGYSKAQLRPY